MTRTPSGQPRILARLTLLTKFVRRVASNPWVFDRVQYVLGFEQTCRRLQPHFAQTDGQIVLDVGAGTGNFAPVLPASATYLWLDNDPHKLRGFRRKGLFGSALVGDAMRICAKDKSVDYGLCIALAHHLSDTELPVLFSELARVIRRRLFLLEPVKYKDGKISDLLWRYDRGRYPRSVQALCSAIAPWFQIEQVERYAIYHQYFFCLASPRQGM